MYQEYPHLFGIMTSYSTIVPNILCLHRKEIGHENSGHGAHPSVRGTWADLLISIPEFLDCGTRTHSTRASPKIHPSIVENLASLSLERSKAHHTKQLARCEIYECATHMHH
jgi:hypothetical protein